MKRYGAFKNGCLPVVMMAMMCLLPSGQPSDSRCVQVAGLIAGLGTAWAAEDWKREFEDVCSKTTDSMALSTDELKSLVERCRKLKPVIGTLEESTRKVYTKRLDMCMRLYEFVLETKLQRQSPEKP